MRSTQVFWPRRAARRRAASRLCHIIFPFFEDEKSTLFQRARLRLEVDEISGLQ